MWFHLPSLPLDLPWFLEWAAVGSAKNNLLFAAIYLNLSRRHCWNACCYGFHLLPLMHVYVCVSTKYTRTGQCVQCPTPLSQLWWKSDTHTFFQHRNNRASQLEGARRLSISRRAETWQTLSSSQEFSVCDQRFVKKTLNWESYTHTEKWKMHQMGMLEGFVGFGCLPASDERCNFLHMRWGMRTE